MEETSKKVRHTKGPWIEVDGFIYSEHTEDRPVIAQLMTCSVSDDDNSLQFTECQNIEANARLIASAPQLLEALEIAQQYVNVFILRGEDPLVGDQIKDHSFKIIEAIKLAKGNGES